MKQFFICMSVIFAVPFFAHGQALSNDRAALEAQLAQVEREIATYQSTIDDYKTKGKTLSSEVKKLDAEAKKLALEIKAITLSLARLDADITKNGTNIQVTDAKLRFNRKALGEAMQSLAEEGDVNLAEMLLTHPALSDFFNNVEGLLSVKDGLSEKVEKVAATKEELIDLKEELARKKADTEYLKQARDTEKKSLAKKKAERDNLLIQTKGQESQYQALMQESKKTAAQIRSRIFEFLGGGQMTFETAYQIAKTAGDLVGVRPAMLLAVLDRESALGKNVGRCSYESAMHPTRDIPLFLALTAELGLNPATTLVSCANKDGAYGGAMGPAQFIPKTWNMYRARIVGLTGSRPPSPWRNIDAFTATALYLKDAGASAVRDDAADRAAAARYYAGGSWRNYLWTYGERVVSKARQFEDDIASLKGTASR